MAMSKGQLAESNSGAACLRRLLEPRPAVIATAMIICALTALEPGKALQVRRTSPIICQRARMWGGAGDTVLRLRDRAVEYCESIRVVYHAARGLKKVEEQQATLEQKTQPRRTLNEDARR